MKLIVGLGNPDREYAPTRHNIGFRVVDLLAERAGLTSWRKKFSGLVVEGTVAGQRAAVMKPQTYMNCSGRSVLAALQFHQCPLEEVLVISDDLDLPVGKLRLREKGSAGGQKGLADIITTLGSNEFARLRFGIGRPAHGSATDHVLGRFSEQENAIVEAALSRAVDVVECWARDGTTKAMNQFNQTSEQESRGDEAPRKE